MKLKMKLTDKQIDKIVVKELNSCLDILTHDLNRVKETNKGYVFDDDPKKDALQIQGRIKAINTVLDYFSIPKN